MIVLKPVLTYVNQTHSQLLLVRLTVELDFVCIVPETQFSAVDIHLYVSWFIVLTDHRAYRCPIEI